MKKALRHTEKDDIGTVISVNAVTETYWVKPFGSTLKYGDVRFDNDYFTNLALKEMALIRGGSRPYLSLYE